MRSDEDVLAEYLAEVRAVPLLPGRDEAHLLSASRNGDQAAKERLVESYLELVALLALQLAPSSLSPLDAIQEANLILIRLIDDPSVAQPAREITPLLVRRYGEIGS
jgi:DNA-directed RNA polymerase sigma subunit (sigma70/sigma32)